MQPASGSTSPRAAAATVSQAQVKTTPSLSNAAKPSAVTLGSSAKAPAASPVSPQSARSAVPSTPKGNNAAAQDIAELDQLISQLERDAQELNRLLN